MSFYDIIERPVLSEKAFEGMDLSIYSFWVKPAATKTDIKIAIEKAFDVNVIGISTYNAVGKRKRVGRFTGHRKARKKAVVRLAAGQTIETIDSLLSAPSTETKE